MCLSTVAIKLNSVLVQTKDGFLLRQSHIIVLLITGYMIHAFTCGVHPSLLQLNFQ